jgi:hypothetical protein
VKPGISEFRPPEAGVEIVAVEIVVKIVLEVRVNPSSFDS